MTRDGQERGERAPREESESRPGRRGDSPLLRRSPAFAVLALAVCGWLLWGFVPDVWYFFSSQEPIDLGGPGAYRLEAARSLLAQQETRLSEKHPDLIRLKRLVADLEKQVAAEELQRPVSPEAAQSQPASAEDARRRDRLREMRAEIESLDRQIAFKARDGAAFDPLSSRMGGVNDDPEIAAVGGWSRVFLDLFQYLGDTVRLRFRFRSDDTVVFAGCYIDDVKVTGRRTNAGVQETHQPEAHIARPAPTIVGDILLLPGMAGGERSAVAAHLLDGSGRKVSELKPGTNDVRGLAPGVYFVREGGVSSVPGGGRIRKVVVAR